MTARERFAHICRFESGIDRLPCIEWAAWWDRTLRRWETEGLPAGMALDASLSCFVLDKMFCTSVPILSDDCPREPHFGAGIIADEAGYERILPYLYREEPIYAYLASVRELNARTDRDEIVWRYWLDGFFWFPRRLLGIENHLTAFYDQPELLHRINNDYCAFAEKVIRIVFSVCPPDMAGIAEDMSYNNGPMLSEAHFREFILPYYQRVVPLMKRYGVPVFVDSDGDVTMLLPWLLSAGIDGIFPLERQAGVDIVDLRCKYPRLLMMGGFDKMVMSRGEEAMRAEFERVLPVMRSGGYVNSVDHQTPPEVSLENYRIYVRLLKEYAEKAAEGFMEGH